ncbi:MAG: hypoxanthine phosphoribosyltransferase [Thermomicrobiales bacterium]|jgi:hypoxanthine phosphoribosyltransferase|nr:hypoxanthine phosphoribosyltransferase [Thermomicrobiales bacterium]
MTKSPVQAPNEAIARVLIEEAAIQARVRELGRQIAADYAGSTAPLMLIGVLRGAVVFMADLIRAIDATLTIDFIAVSSYGASTKSSGVVRILKDINESIEGANVIIVEDIIDSGLTLAYLLDLLHRRNPADLRVCAFLLKDRPRDHALPDIPYVGFTIPDEFVIGYGLDYAGRYRNLPYVGVLSLGPE